MGEIIEEDFGDRRESIDPRLIETVVRIIRDQPAIYAINEETHREHHAYIVTLLEERQRKIERWEKIRTSVIGWLIITIFGTVGTYVFNLFTHAKDHAK